MKKTIFLLISFLLFGTANSLQQKFDPTNFVVVGGAVSAGFADFVLIEQSQKHSFPALMAERMGTIMPLPLFRDGGPVAVISFDPLPDLLPKFNQSTLRSLPFPLFTFNLSVPFVKVSESLNSRPTLPLVREGEAKQSLINLILGYPALLFEEPPSWSQIEYAEQMAPTFVIAEIGSGDVLEATLTGDTGQITPIASFTTDYTTLVRRLKNTNATVLLMNVADPTETAYFSTVQEVARLYNISSESLVARFGLRPADLITLGGLVEIGQELMGQHGVLSSRAVLRAPTVAAIRSAVQGFNSAISSIGSSLGMRVFDLDGFIREIKLKGVQAGSVRVGGGYLQGFYSTDGLFPTPVGHALLANRLLQFINVAYGTNFPLLDLEAIAQRSKETSTPLKVGFETLLKIE